MAREHIGERIRAARLRASLSPVELAGRAGIRPPTMYRYERRWMVPGAEVLMCIVAALGVSGGSATIRRARASQLAH